MDTKNREKQTTYGQKKTFYKIKQLFSDALMNIYDAKTSSPPTISKKPAYFVLLEDSGHFFLLSDCGNRLFEILAKEI